VSRWSSKRVAVAAAVVGLSAAAVVAVVLTGESGSTDRSRLSAGPIRGVGAPSEVTPASEPSATSTPSRGPRPPTSTAAPANVDVRRPQGSAAQTAAQQRSAQLKARPAVQRLARSLGAQGIVDIDPVTGTPRQVERLDGLLTAASTAPASAIALGYVRAHAAAFGLDAADIDGLHLARDYVDILGTHHLSYTQGTEGLTLFGNGLKANVTKAGRLVNLTGSPVHGLAAALHRPGSGPTQQVSTAAAAVRAAKKSAGEPVLTRGRNDVVTQVLFQTPAGPRRAWQVVAMSAVNPALSVIDAQTGAVLYRDRLGSDLVSAPTPYTAQVWFSYPQPAPAGPGGAARTVPLTANGWLAAGAQSLNGNNVHTYLDTDGSDTVATTEEVRPTGTGGYGFPVHPVTVSGSNCTTSVCTWVPTTAYSWQANNNAARTATQNFYFINVWHDYLKAAPIGFDEAAGNFQKVNSSGQGNGGDAVLDETLSGAAVAAGKPAAGFTNNADFATPPDGQAPTMRMFLFKPVSGEPFLPVAGSDSADIVYHEYTHGLSHRLVVDASGNPAVDSLQGEGMGEAWSDWYGLDYLVDNSATTGVTDSPATPDVIEGRYVLGPTSQTGIRSEPIDCPVGSSAPACAGIATTGGGGYTYGDFRTIWNRTSGDVHAAGEIWGQTLWDLRGAMISTYGQTAGAQRAESLVTRAMELSPAYPSMLDLRNAVLAADQADYAGADMSGLWSVFAARGMGFFASTRGGDDLQPVEDFTPAPAPGGPTGTLSGMVTNTAGGGPLAGITVAISGHDSGFPGDYVATTDAAGHYAMAGLVPGTYPSFYLSGGVVATPRPVTVAAGANVENWTVARDWAAVSGGAKVVDFTGVNLSTSGCGPDAAFDLSQTVGWASDVSEGAPFVVVKLASPADVTTFSVDPTNTCGDAPAAGLRQYRIDTSPDGVTWSTAISGTFLSSNMHKLNVLTPADPPTAVRWVRLTMVSAQVTGQDFIDLTELEVFGPQSPGLPRGDHQGGGTTGTVLGGSGQLAPLPR
jgi:extracellular elastinolytic metalloproteinase